MCVTFYASLASESTHMHSPVQNPPLKNGENRSCPENRDELELERSVIVAAMRKGESSRKDGEKDKIRRREGKR